MKTISCKANNYDRHQAVISLIITATSPGNALRCAILTDHKKNEKDNERVFLDGECNLVNFPPEKKELYAKYRDWAKEQLKYFNVTLVESKVTVPYLRQENRFELTNTLRTPTPVPLKPRASKEVFEKTERQTLGRVAIPVSEEFLVKAGKMLNVGRVYDVVQKGESYILSNGQDTLGSATFSNAFGSVSVTVPPAVLFSGFRYGVPFSVGAYP